MPMTAMSGIWTVCEHFLEEKVCGTVSILSMEVREWLLGSR